MSQHETIEVSLLILLKEFGSDKTIKTTEKCILSSMVIMGFVEKVLTSSYFMSQLQEKKRVHMKI